jgi:hypothetical protein
MSSGSELHFRSGFVYISYIRYITADFNMLALECMYVNIGQKDVSSDDIPFEVYVDFFTINTTYIYSNK